jgi:hypothetical protein
MIQFLPRILIDVIVMVIIGKISVRVPVMLMIISDGQIAIETKYNNHNNNNNNKIVTITIVVIVNNGDLMAKEDQMINNNVILTTIIETTIPIIIEEVVIVGKGMTILIIITTIEMNAHIEIMIISMMIITECNNKSKQDYDIGMILIMIEEDDNDDRMMNITMTLVEEMMNTTDHRGLTIAMKDGDILLLLQWTVLVIMDII